MADGILRSNVADSLHVSANLRPIGRVELAMDHNAAPPYFRE